MSEVKWLLEEIDRLKGENDQLEATNIRVTQMVSDFKARVAELEGQDVVSSICESCHDGYSYSAPERKTSFLLGVTCPACLGDNIEILMSERDRYLTALREIAPVVLKLTNDFITDNAHLPFAELLIANFKPNIDKLYAEVNRIATEALEVKDE